MEKIDLTPPAQATGTLFEFDAFYRQVGDGMFESSVHAQGAWNPHEQHMAPVSGIMARALVTCEARTDLRLARINFDILGLIEGGRFTLETRVIRPGRTIELVQCELIANGRTAVRALGWRLLRTDTTTVAAVEEAAMESPDRYVPTTDLGDIWPGGYIKSLEMRAHAGNVPGRGQVWLRNPYEMVEGETTVPFVRLLGMVDTANGIVARERPGAGSWMFPNVDLSIHLFRDPVGEWLGLDTTQTFGTDGIGLTSSILNDIDGPFGRSAQMLTLRQVP